MSFHDPVTNGLDFIVAQFGKKCLSATVSFPEVLSLSGVGLHALAKVLLAALFLTFTTIPAQAIDCAKARTKVERYICQNDELREREQMIDAALSLAMERSNQKPLIAAEQKVWFAERNLCESLQCIVELTENRLSKIRQDLSRVGIEAPASSTASSSTFDPMRVAALIDRSRNAVPPDQRPANLASPPLTSPPLTMSEIDAIRSQIQSCWSVPASARDAHNLVVRIKFSLNLDGSLSGAPEVIDTSRMNETTYREAAESAIGAIRQCSPLKYLPLDKYERWRKLEMNFNPQE